MLFISMDHRPAIVSPASKAVRPTMVGAPIQRRSCAGVGVRVRECERVCACVRVRACMRACVRDVFAIYDNYILPRLIIIKIIILYFIQIRHTVISPKRVHV